MANKTVQALKINASWTPNTATADFITAHLFGGGPASPLKFSGGRFSLKHAIKTDFSDPAQATRVSERVAEIKSSIEALGQVHSFTTTAGAVPVDEVEVLPDLKKETEEETVTGDGTGDATPPADDTEKSSGSLLREATAASGNGAGRKGSKPPAFA